MAQLLLNDPIFLKTANKANTVLLPQRRKMVLRAGRKQSFLNLRLLADTEVSSFTDQIKNCRILPQSQPQELQRLNLKAEVVLSLYLSHPSILPSFFLPLTAPSFSSQGEGITTDV